MPHPGPAGSPVPAEHVSGWCARERAERCQDHAAASYLPHTLAAASYITAFADLPAGEAAALGTAITPAERQALARLATRATADAHQWATHRVLPDEAWTRLRFELAARAALHPGHSIPTPRIATRPAPEQQRP